MGTLNKKLLKDDGESLNRILFNLIPEKNIKYLQA